MSAYSRAGLTYTAHPISLAAAIANIQVIQEDQLVERAHQMGPVLHRMLADLGEQHPSVGEVRSIGLFGVIELVRDRRSKEPMAPFDSSSPEMAALRKRLLAQGLFLYSHWHTLLIIPPLIITEAQLAEGFKIWMRLWKSPTGPSRLELLRFNQTLALQREDAPQDCHGSGVG
jgi:taurine---2-oxoglutarate transaminase